MRPEAFELNPDNYPYNTEIGTRFGDLDVLNHVNNVKIGQLLEEGRMRFNLAIRSHNTDTERMERSAVRLVTASTLVTYLAEVFYPAPVTVYSAITRIGTSSYNIGSLMLQNGKPVAHCRATFVRSDAGTSAPLPETMLADISANQIRRPASA
jgi:acyl-CoA thioester hydrolase